LYLLSVKASNSGSQMDDEKEQLLKSAEHPFVISV